MPGRGGPAKAGCAAAMCAGVRRGRGCSPAAADEPRQQPTRERRGRSLHRDGRSSKPPQRLLQRTLTISEAGLVVVAESGKALQAGQHSRLGECAAAGALRVGHPHDGRRVGSERRDGHGCDQECERERGHARRRASAEALASRM